MMTDAQAFNHLLETANGFANKIDANIMRTNDLHEFMNNVTMNAMALAAATQICSPITTAKVIIGLTLLLRRPDDINKITLVNATNVKDVKDE
jgi:hypothetical protein